MSLHKKKLLIYSDKLLESLNGETNKHTQSEITTEIHKLDCKDEKEVAMGNHCAVGNNVVHWTLSEQSTSAGYAGILVL